MASDLVDRFDGFQRRHRWLGLPLAVVYKFLDDSGTYLAGLLTYYGFASVFPLLLLLNTVLGYLLGSDAHLQQLVLHSALRQFPIIGDQLGQNIHSLHGSVLAVVIGVLGALYGGLGIANAAQYASNTLWGVPHTKRPGLPAEYGRSLLLLVIVGVGLTATTALAGLALPNAAALGVVVRVLATVAAVMINIGLFVLAMRVLVSAPVTLRTVLPGAICAAIAWQALQQGGTYYVVHELAWHERHLRVVRHRARPAGLDLPGCDDLPDLLGGERGAREPVVAARRAQHLHRRGTPHQGRPRHLSPIRHRGAAQDRPACPGAFRRPRT